MSSLPSFAIRLHGGMDSRACAAHAEHAEHHGFQAVWFAENPFQRGVLPAASACVLATTNIQVGIGVFNPFNRHPTLMAMEIGALDELSGGRAILGIGAGVPQTIKKFATFEKIADAMRDTISIVGPLLSGEEVVHLGKVFSADHVRLSYGLSRARIPVYVAAMGDRMLRLCGEAGDGLLISNMCPPSFTQRAKELMSAGANEIGHKPPVEIVKYVPCVVASHRSEARRSVKPAIGAMLGAYWKAYQTAPAALSAIGSNNGIDPDHFLKSLERLGHGEQAEDVLDDEFVTAYGVAGTVDQCLDQCHELGQTGVTQMTLTFQGDRPQESLAALGEAARTYRS
ncbi:MAG: LLM class flavin-dependent oxidoreductase [Pseudomonadota bacterium]|nr:LLM class flavin-dependent oxidoreductase [Pseudomonadota bacterium]